MKYIYKQLSRYDVSLLKDLLGVFGEAFDEPDTYQGNIPSDDYLKTLLGNEQFIVVVAQNGKIILGGLVAYVLKKFEQIREEIYIYDLAVSKDSRRLGIATGLIQKLKQIGRERGAYVIFVQADKGDTAAIKLYESLGTREEVFHFDIKVN
jgi:aminoglycoside 3-N-acetyltransferase I